MESLVEENLRLVVTTVLLLMKAEPVEEIYAAERVAPASMLSDITDRKVFIDDPFVLMLCVGPSVSICDGWKEAELTYVHSSSWRSNKWCGREHLYFERQ